VGEKSSKRCQQKKAKVEQSSALAIHKSIPLTHNNLPDSVGGVGGVWGWVGPTGLLSGATNVSLATKDSR
jgi:hypothetical protein